MVSIVTANICHISIDHVCVHLQSHKTEALAGKLSAVYGVVSTPDFIKQKRSHAGHKSQVRKWLLSAWMRGCP